MQIKYPILLSLFLATACAPILSEERSTIVVGGKTYELRTQTIDGSNGPYERSSVLVNNRHFICILDSPGDCEAAVRLARADFDRR